ncbi:peptidase S8/S53 domain-containing protein [Mycena capillaripes]|nr:peptidase S8/S53 domain-containing protein [Mycena capillaripes]
MASSLIALALAFAAAISGTPLSHGSSISPTLAPFPENHRHGPINNSYKPSQFLVAAHQAQPSVDDDFAIRHVYDHINGYSGRFSQKSVEQLRSMPEVDFIERDQIFRIQATQTGAPWVIAVKVLGSNSSGSMSDVIAGLIYATTSVVTKANEGDPSHKGSAINMSLGRGSSRALDLTVNGAVDAGVHVAVAAGNDDRGACNYSPARAEKAITVGASTLGDERAYFSNYGNALGHLHDIAAHRGTARVLPFYSSLSFGPERSPLPEPADLQQPFPFFDAPGSHLYAVSHAVLPGWVTSFFPQPRIVEPLSVNMKAALLNLATQNVITDVKGSPSLLIFHTYAA